MADAGSRTMATVLGKNAFTPSGDATDAVNDPIADTPMTVTLDEIQPYDLNPRLMRNPRYDEIKASIRERGLDSPPAITRRPGEKHYIIRNGGNTRLAILRELWSETRDQRFFRISCLFRPWRERGEILALTGHLAENELHGGLSFIERALGIEKARELYEQETGQMLSQSELNRRLNADGYPLNQPLISRMHDAVCYLLPAIPTVLYSGLGRLPVERLLTLRRVGARIWESHSQAKNDLRTDFTTLFHDVLSTFDGPIDDFSDQHVQDELVGQMAESLDVDYETLTLEFTEIETRQRGPEHEPSPPSSPPSAEDRRSESTPQLSREPAGMRSARPAEGSSSASSEMPAVSQKSDHAPSGLGETSNTKANPTSATLLSARHSQPMLNEEADRRDEKGHKAAEGHLEPARAQGLPTPALVELWSIAETFDTAEHLRRQIAQVAREIANEAKRADLIIPTNDGIGFACSFSEQSHGAKSEPLIAQAVPLLLAALSAGYRSEAIPVAMPKSMHLPDVLRPLVHGGKDNREKSVSGLSDESLVKLFRLIRLARRMSELEVGDALATDKLGKP